MVLHVAWLPMYIHDDEVAGCDDDTVHIAVMEPVTPTGELWPSSAMLKGVMENPLTAALPVGKADDASIVLCHSLIACVGVLVQRYLR